MTAKQKNGFLCPFLAVFRAVVLSMKLVDCLAMVNATRKSVPQPFSMEFYTLDRKQKKGGEIKSVRDYIGTGSNHDAMEQGTITIKPARGHIHPITVHIRNIKSINGHRVFW